MDRLARFCIRRRRVVLACWLATLGVLLVVGHGIGSAYRLSLHLAGTDSARATDLLAANFPDEAGDAEVVVAHTSSSTVTNPNVRRRVARLVTRIAAIDHVRAVTSPYDAAGQISTDRRVAFAVVHFDATVPDPIAVDRLVTTAEAAQDGQVRIALAGDAVGAAQRTKHSNYELAGLALAALVLFLAFGSLVAMLLPLLSAGVAVGVAISLVGLLSHAVTLADFAPGLASLLGLGAGVDYALFVVSRHRQQLLAGADVEQAAATALATSGRTVFFAGLTVCVAVLGMLALHVGFLAGMAVAAALAVAVTMAAALTLLPALLGFADTRVLSRRERRRVASQGPDALSPSPGWLRWSRTVQRRPWAALAGSLLLIGLLAVPLVSLRFGNSDQGNDPAGSTTRRAYDLLATGFGPGFNAPMLIAVGTTSVDARAVIARLGKKLTNTADVAAVSPVSYSPNGRAATITVYPDSRPQDASTINLLHRLRDTVIPAAANRRSVPVYVGGTTAAFADFTHVLASKLPLFVGVILALSFVLLLLVVRSVLVPVKAGLLTVLSILGAFGAVVAVFQWGWGAGLIGVRAGPVEAFLPVMLFAILFGLSMDYEVFLVSRIREEWRRTGDNSEAVARGLAVTGRLITAAAAIMVMIFTSFIFGEQRVIKLFGFGFAVAVFLDAVVIRSVLAPAVMHLAGRANWWLPRWLDRRLPHLGTDMDAPEVTTVNSNVIAGATRSTCGSAAGFATPATPSRRKRKRL